MKNEGPPLEVLLRRIAETPGEFHGTPRVAGRGDVHVDAVVADLARSFGKPASLPALLAFRGASAKDRNTLSVALLLAWVLADEWFRSRKEIAERVPFAISEAAADLAPSTAADVFTKDPDRREEMARLLLARLEFRPAGETVAQAQDRLTSISAAERTRVIQAARAAEERARAIREALARKAAEESADKYTRE